MVFLGCILFEMLVGYAPFYAETPAETADKILRHETTLEFPRGGASLRRRQGSGQPAVAAARRATVHRRHPQPSILCGRRLVAAARGAAAARQPSRLRRTRSTLKSSSRRHRTRS